MVSIEIAYSGELRCQAVHEPSQSSLITDAPTDNQGRGEAFSPTDLVATALGTCVLTIMGIYAAREGLPIAGLSARVNKIMTAAPPRKIARLELIVTMPAGLDPKHRECLERCADRCPVRHSLDPSVEVPVRFVYPD